jgi:hypothetical protein
MGGGGDTDWALALAIYFLSLFMNVCVALTRGCRQSKVDRVFLRLESSEKVFVRLTPGPSRFFLFS